MYLQYIFTHFYTYRMEDVLALYIRIPPMIISFGFYVDGRPLPWEDVQKILPAGSYQENAKWTFLTYEVFPF